MPSGATEFRAAVGCWRDRRLHCKARRRHGGVRRSGSRQTASPSANARAPWGRETTSDSRPAFLDESAALAGEVGATREAWVSCLVGRKANAPSSEDPPSRRGNLDLRLPFGRSRVADSRDRAVRPARQRSPDDHTRDYDRGVGKGTHAGLPPATKVESGLRRMAEVNPSASRPPLKNIGQSHHGRLQRSLGSVSSTFAPPGPSKSRARLAFQYSWADSFGPTRLSGIGPADQKKELLLNRENVVGRG